MQLRSSLLTSAYYTHTLLGNNLYVDRESRYISIFPSCHIYLSFQRIRETVPGERSQRDLTEDRETTIDLRETTLNNLR